MYSGPVGAPGSGALRKFSKVSRRGIECECGTRWGATGGSQFESALEPSRVERSRLQRALTLAAAGLSEALAGTSRVVPPARGTPRSVGCRPRFGRACC